MIEVIWLASRTVHVLSGHSSVLSSRFCHGRSEYDSLAQKRNRTSPLVCLERDTLYEAAGSWGRASCSSASSRRLLLCIEKLNSIIAIAFCFRSELIPNLEFLKTDKRTTSILPRSQIYWLLTAYANRLEWSRPGFFFPGGFLSVLWLWTEPNHSVGRQTNRRGGVCTCTCKNRGLPFPIPSSSDPGDFAGSISEFRNSCDEQHCDPGRHQDVPTPWVSQRHRSQAAGSSGRSTCASLRLACDLFMISPAEFNQCLLFFCVSINWFQTFFVYDKGLRDAYKNCSLKICLGHYRWFAKKGFHLVKLLPAEAEPFVSCWKHELITVKPWGLEGWIFNDTLPYRWCATAFLSCFVTLGSFGLMGAVCQRQHGARIRAHRKFIFF